MTAREELATAMLAQLEALDGPFAPFVHTYGISEVIVDGNLDMLEVADAALASAIFTAVKRAAWLEGFEAGGNNYGEGDISANPYGDGS
jgi:hypothetical protein